MLKAEQVPQTVIDAAYRAYWHEKPNSGFAEAIAAAINAWPGMYVEEGLAGLRSSPDYLILPLTETDDD